MGAGGLSGQPLFEKSNEVARLFTIHFTDVVLNDKECSERKFGAVFFQSLQTTQI